MVSPILDLFILSLVLLMPLQATGLAQQDQGEQKWPHPVPCRIHDSGNRDLFVMTLGKVETALAQGVFDPVRDEVRLSDGSIIRHYYRDTLGVAFYAPLDKTVFALPPSGWCSWYYYYQEINEEEIRRNAEWIAENLKDYGALYVQIDDGWQGTGHGLGENRDWTTINQRFSRGMDRLADDIKGLGLLPGLWLAPHGQSNEAVVKAHPHAFLLKPDGTSASQTWEGMYLVDPSAKEGQQYLRELFRRLSEWGYDYFKIDGQPIVIAEYRKKKAFMKHPAEKPDSLYRETLKSIRAAIGSNRYLLGCWGIPLDGAGIMNGSRTGGDVVLGWQGFKVALNATMRYYFLHNIVWYNDPDVMLLRAPLSLDQARAWATLQGLTGQALMSSDRMMDLSDERVEILRRVYPAVDIRPLDLFPAGRDKRIWDLKINHLNRQYDVVGVFNFDEEKSEALFLNWADLGLGGDSLIHVYDFWNREYLGQWEKGIVVQVPATGVRVLTLLPAQNRPQLISTSRHITQGWVDLLNVEYDSDAKTYSGASRVVKNDPYRLTFVFPRGQNFEIVSARASNASDDLPVRIANRHGWATVEFVSPQSGVVSWRASFAPAKFYHFPVHAPYGLSVLRVGLDGADVRWSENYWLSAGYRVYLDGQMQGYTPHAVFPLRGLNPDRVYRVAVKTVWEDGSESEKAGEIEFNLKSTLPEEIYLSEIEPVRATCGWRTVQMDRSVSGGALSIGGRYFARGIGTHANSDIEFAIYGLYRTFSATVGIDDGSDSDQGSVQFIVYGDGKQLWQSGVMKKSDGSKKVNLHIAGVRTLRLVVRGAGDGIDYDHADWAEAKLSGL